MRDKFKSGAVVVTRGVNDLIAENEDFAKFVHASIGRHFLGDWGQTCAEDAQGNEDALVLGERLLSVYERAGLPTIWIITEWGRSVTTVLFPSEY